jgi:hypothetical protein
MSVNRYSFPIETFNVFLILIESNSNNRNQGFHGKRNAGLNCV